MALNLRSENPDMRVKAFLVPHDFTEKQAPERVER